jgi:hypothetical protein
MCASMFEQMGMLLHMFILIVADACPMDPECADKRCCGDRQSFNHSPPNDLHPDVSAVLKNRVSCAARLLQLPQSTLLEERRWHVMPASCATRDRHVISG